MSALKFTVLGKPQPAGSKRAFAHKQTGRIIVTDDAKGSRPWKQAVAAEARAAIVAAREGDRFAAPLDGPVSLTVTFYVRRPASHYGTGRNRDRLKPSAPGWPTTRPDATKLLRAVEDAMTDAGVWRDDAQVVVQMATKEYAAAGEPERAEVAVKEIATVTVAVWRVLVCPACGATSTDPQPGKFWSRAGRCHLGDEHERVRAVEYVPDTAPVMAAAAELERKLSTDAHCDACGGPCRDES